MRGVTTQVCFNRVSIGATNDLGGCCRMLRKACAVFVTAAVLFALSATGAAAFAPAPGPLFNNPRGTKVAKNRILHSIVAAVDHAPRHSTIRIAAYSFDRPDVADALVRAHNRGVDVQMVLNDNWTSKATLRLQRHFGQDPNRSSFVVICRQSCRGGAGNQHMKFYMFSKSGKANNVVMVGSANLTGYGAQIQWNDMYTVSGNAAMFNLYSKVFEQLARDRRVARPYLTKSVGSYENRFFPHPSTTVSTDPVMRRLNKVRCRPGGRRTAIRIVMYGWVGTRGLYLADKVADLDRRGCDVRAILSAGGAKVYRHLKAGGVLVKSADLDLNGNPDDGFENSGYELFTHEKWMILNGGYGATTSYNVWTGSENWSDLALRNDEVTIRIPRRAAYRQYLTNFNYIWGHWSRWM
jgi:phosphatidylserine/phosphatidylglycerophosphate/cardiolipin synthase-like enzyme